MGNYPDFLGAIALLLSLVGLLGFRVLSQGQGLLLELKEGLKQQDQLLFQDFLNQLNLNDVIDKLQTGLTSGLGIVRGIFSSIFLGIFGAGMITLWMQPDLEKTTLQLTEDTPEDVVES
ncbi:hypothetical protein J5X98_21035 [Leptothermofonsia sichuanensis E412]|uniref:hypothetical protein n=1 Tax=Leptothermofonsia sichuanensis TaxID=2917832 RepID=UPI001CA5FAEE|nr:hypothetical protein [Leptothermofonsia sichuanensis]QZZ19776.1 hypothetical protein J5X98_21035 [Leptothermofonsia sichuanensis E412]